MIRVGGPLPGAGLAAPERTPRSSSMRCRSALDAASLAVKEASYADAVAANVSSPTSASTACRETYVMAESGPGASGGGVRVVQFATPRRAPPWRTHGLSQFILAIPMLIDHKQRAFGSLGP